MPNNPLQLADIFQTVTARLVDKQAALNEADTYNHDHGDNMVEIFQVITEAIGAQRSAAPADQLSYAGELLRERRSGSAQMYAQGLSEAAHQFAGQSR